MRGVKQERVSRSCFEIQILIAERAEIAEKCSQLSAISASSARSALQFD